MNLANFFNFLDILKSLEKDSSVFILFLYIAITHHIDDTTKKFLATLCFGFIFIIFLFANIFVNQKEFDCYITLNGAELANKEIIINGEEFITNEYGIININKNFLHSTISIPNEDNIYYKWKKNENSNTKYNLFIYYIPDFITVKNKKYFDVDIDRCSNIEIEMHNKKYGKIYFDESSVHSIQIGNIDVKYAREDIDLLNTMSIPLPKNILPGIFYLNVNFDNPNDHCSVGLFIEEDEKMQSLYSKQSCGAIKTESGYFITNELFSKIEKRNQNVNIIDKMLKNKNNIYLCVSKNNLDNIDKNDCYQIVIIENK